MSIFLAEDIKCTHTDCGKRFSGHHPTIQYANVKYKAICPHCGRETVFNGQASVRFKGSVDAFPEVFEIQAEPK